MWQFLKNILEMGVMLLKPNTGKYMTHCIGANATEALVSYEKVLAELAGGKCSYTQSKSFVSSFMETWVFYQIIRSE